MDHLYIQVSDPEFISNKRCRSTNNWTVFDTARETFNPIDKNLHWDTTDSRRNSTDRQYRCII